MSGNFYSSLKPQRPAKFAEAMLRLAEAHAGGLRQAFHNSVVERRDASSWLRLEVVCADLLKKRRDRISHKGYAHEPAWLSPNGKCERDFEERLNRSSGERAEAYVRAVDELLHNTAHWTFIFEALTASYWRHASLVWMSLWHAVLTPDVTAAEAAICLGLTVRRKGDPGAAAAAPIKAVPVKLKQIKALGLSIWKRHSGPVDARGK